MRRGGVRGGYRGYPTAAINRFPKPRSHSSPGYGEIKSPAPRVYGQLHYDSNPPFQWWVAPDVGLAECRRICEEDLADWGCRYVSYVTGPADPHCFVHQDEVYQVAELWVKTQGENTQVRLMLLHITAD